ATSRRPTATSAREPTSPSSSPSCCSTSRAAAGVSGSASRPRKTCFFAERPYKPQPSAPSRPGAERTVAGFLLKLREPPAVARRPVFPPSEHSSLSRKGSKGYAPGRASWQLRERHFHAPL